MIKVVHNSRYIDYIFNFAVSENNLSWSLTAEGDGDFFINPLTNGLATNVATLTVNGSTPTYPVTVTNGSSVSVAITKTTNGETASVTLRQRRQIIKINTIAVPDFGAYTGRYLYVLLNNNTIQKLDSQLLLPSNYAGAGAWTVNPVVATITLPTLPNTAVYSRIKFVKIGGVEKLLISGQGQNVQTYFYASYLVLSSDSVYDLALTTLNGYTNIITINALYASGRQENCQYDFINEFVYIGSAAGSQGNTVLKLNLATNAVTNLVYSGFADAQMTTYEHQFSPIDQQFCAIGDYSLELSRTLNYKTVTNNGVVWGYNYRNNYRICTGDTFGKLNYFNSNGLFTGFVNYGTIGVFGCTEIYGFDRANTVFMSFVDSYSIVNRNTSTAKYRTTDKELTAPNNYLLNLRNCHYSDIYVAFCGTSARIPATRMVVFKENEATADFGYLDFANTIYSADANQLLI